MGLDRYGLGTIPRLSALVAQSVEGPQGTMIPITLSLIALLATSQTLPYQNPQLSAVDRARDLVSRMTSEEKIAQCMMDAPAIPRLGVPKYHYWSEALHGI